MNLNIGTTACGVLTLVLPPVTKEVLTAQGITAPDTVTLELREATMRERQQFEKDQAEVARQNPVPWMTQMVMARAEAGTDQKVVQELVADMTPTDFALVTAAYLQGIVPDVDTTAAVVRRATGGLTSQLMNGLAEDPTDQSHEEPAAVEKPVRRPRKGTQKA
ncbi:hypothetical protein ACFQDE_21040 [Deinococcus caeni]